MSKHFKMFLIALGLFVGGFALLVVVAIVERARKYEADAARLKESQYKLQLLKEEINRIEAERAGNEAVREYDMKHASQEELGRMHKASMRELDLKQVTSYRAK